MKIRIYNAKILTMENGMDIVTGEIHIEDDRIARIIPDSPCKTSSGYLFDRQINADGNLIMPGFKNAHAHSPMTFARSLADDLPLDRWLKEKIFPMEAKLSDDNIRIFSKIAIMEYLAGGITASFDMYFRPENIVDAALDMGFRSVICGAVNDFVESVPRMEGLYDKYNSSDNLNSRHDLISFKLGFHAEYTTGEGLLKDIAALAHEKKAPVYCHNSETKSEVEGCIDRHGLTPVAYLDSLGMFDWGGGGFHLIYTDDNDLDIIKRRGIHVVTNPASNGKLASGIAPLLKYLDAGINIGIGTDGPSSNNSLDMFREMYLTTVYQKLYTENAAAMDADKVLYMATVGGARAMELDDCDVLAPNKKADLIMIDLSRPNMQPINNIPTNLVYSGSTSNVMMTMINGRILYEKGEFLIGDDPLDLYAKANEMMKVLR